MQVVKRTEDGTEVDVVALLLLLWSKKIRIILSTVLGGLVVYAAVYFLVTPQYESSVTLYVNNKTTTDSSSVTSADLSAASRLVETYEAIIKSGRVMDICVEQAALDMTADELSEKVEVAAVNDTEVFSVTVTDPDPEQAASLVGILTDAIVDEISEIVEGASVKVINEAKVPTEISSPSYKKWAVVGAAAGMLICVIVIIVMTLADTRIKSEADLENWDYPVLGVIPEWEGAKKVDEKISGTDA